MIRGAPAVLAAACCVAGFSAPVASAAIGPSNSATSTFSPRSSAALGLIPSLKQQSGLGRQDSATGAPIGVTYHGGAVMAGGVTVHTIFWSGGSNPFQGQPPGAPADYVGMIAQFLTDVAHDSGTSSNVFSVLPQYAEGTQRGAITPGAYAISYDKTDPSDLIVDNDPYPVRADQCASPGGAGVCLTDGQVQSELDSVIQGTPATPRGLHNLWLVLLPPGVDECVQPGVCGTNTFLGYHSVYDLGSGATIYAVAVDPLIEATLGPGADPQGYPDAEQAIDTVAHETLEAISDPDGVGYLDPNGFEIGDKCDIGPQRGTPLGFAADGSPYNQVIDGHRYLLDEVWANADISGAPACVQDTTNLTNPLPLPQVNLTQFSPVVTGNIETGSGAVSVRVSLIRFDSSGNRITVAQAATTSALDGTWSVSLAPHAVGDDRDELDIDYSGSGAPTPRHQVILTGSGGDPFTQGGWTGWTALDHSTALDGTSLTLALCAQTGVLSAMRNGTPLSAPNGDSLVDLCSTQTDTAVIPIGGRPAGRSDVLTIRSTDNRLFAPPDVPSPDPVGGLVSLTVPTGEPTATSLVDGPLPGFSPTGFPTCSADLEGQAVTCTGLIAGASYTLRDGALEVNGNADGSGILSQPLAVRGGDPVALLNGVRTLTTLHVAHLRLDVTGEQSIASGGSCEPGDYYAPPLTVSPTSLAAGEPADPATEGPTCPVSGDATGLPVSHPAQTDDGSGGQTTTEVPDILDTSPMNGETIYGQLSALAESGLQTPTGSLKRTDPTSDIAVTITPASGGPPVFASGNVDTTTGASVPPLPPGPYSATWVLSDRSGDTRTIVTRFVEESPVEGPPGPAGVQGPPGAAGPAGPQGKQGVRGPAATVTCRLLRRGTIRCKVTFRSANLVPGTLLIRLSRGGSAAALGHARLARGATTITLHALGRVTAGRWTATLVLRQRSKPARTIRTRLRVS